MPPGTACFSASNTRQRASAAWMALNAPANPKPTTTTSNDSSKLGMPLVCGALLAIPEWFRVVVLWEQERPPINSGNADGLFARDCDDRVEEILSWLDQFRTVRRIVDASCEVPIRRGDRRIGDVYTLSQDGTQSVIALEYRIGIIQHRRQPGHRLRIRLRPFLRNHPLQIEQVRPKAGGFHQRGHIDNHPLLAPRDWAEGQRAELQRRIHLASCQKLIQQRRGARHQTCVGPEINVVGFLTRGARDQPVKEGRAERADLFALEVRKLPDG